MASLQCHKPAKTCEQKCNSSNNSSGLGQKAAEIASWVTGKHGQTTTETHCHSQAQAQAQAQHHALHATSKTEIGASTGCGQSMAKPTAQTHCLDSASGHGHKATNSGVAAGCKVKTNKKKGEHKKNKDKSLLQKMKDGLSGNSSCSDSSSSDSESDSEGCRKRKN